MGDKLKQIWAGFEETTTRKLTGGGIANIHVPSRLNARDRDAEPLPEGVAEPVEAAFSALRAKLKNQEAKFSLPGSRKRKAALPSEAPEEIMLQSHDGDELIKGMRATALRTQRSEYDYTSFMATSEGKSLLKKHKRSKKRFGFF